MTTRLTPAQQVPSALGRLSTMCCSRLVPGDRQRGRGGGCGTQNATGRLVWCCVHGVTSKMPQRGSGSISGPTGRAERLQHLPQAGDVSLLALSCCKAGAVSGTWRHPGCAVG